MLIDLTGLPPGAIPMALRSAHRRAPVDAVVEVRVAAAPAGARSVPTQTSATVGPETPKAGWTAAALELCLVGAGFAVEPSGRSPSPPGSTGVAAIEARARRERTLADTVGPGMRLLVCGLNPSVRAADAGIGFVTPGNRFWPAALAAGLVTVDRDPDHALDPHGIGMTDLVKRATPGADAIGRDEYRAGLVRLCWLVSWLRPRVTCFVGLAGWRAAIDRRAIPGVQPAGHGLGHVYLLPSTSGRNAVVPLADLVAHLRAALALTDVG